MDILLYKDGHLSISESPLQGKENDLDDVVMLVSNPQEGDTLTYKDGKWVNGEGGGGSGGGAMLLTVTKTEMGHATKYELNKTWKEIKDALAEGTQMVLYGEGTGEAAGMYVQFTVIGVGEDDGRYVVLTYAGLFNGSYEWYILGLEDKAFTANSEDGYPMININD